MQRELNSCRYGVFSVLQDEIAELEHKRDINNP